MRVELEPSSYRTEHVHAVSKKIPGMLSVFVVHHVVATVAPMSRCDFFVRKPHYDGFFLWQPRSLVELLLRERRSALLDEVAAVLRGPDAAPNPAASWLAITVKVVNDGEEEEINLKTFVTRFTTPNWRGSVPMRRAAMRRIIEGLFPRSNKVVLKPIAQVRALPSSPPRDVRRGRSSPPRRVPRGSTRRACCASLPRTWGASPRPTKRRSYPLRAAPTQPAPRWCC